MYNTRDFAQDLEQWERDKVVSRHPHVSFDEIKRDGVVIYGASVIGGCVALLLTACGITPRFFVDRNLAMTGKRVKGAAQVRGLEALADLGGSFVLIATTHVAEVRRFLEARGVNKWVLPYAISGFCPTLCDIGISMCENLRNDALLNGIMMFDDEKSRAIYKQFVKWHYVYDNDFMALSDPVEYFPSGLRERIDYSRFVDCGAFNGDTLAVWAAETETRYAELEYWAFEPSADAFTQLCERSANYERVNFHLINAGAGDQNIDVPTAASSTGVNIIESSAKAAARPSDFAALKRLDDIMRYSAPTVIKADIEGCEMSMLRGAEETIRRCRPTLMISVYHKFSDIYAIPRWILGLGLGYRVYLRHFPPRFTDTTCYAIPNDI